VSAGVSETRTLPPGVTEKDVVWFTCGDCSSLALEINRLTGWPIHSFLTEGSPDLHVFVVPHEGWRLDIRGLSLAREHDEHWSCAEHRELADQEFMDIWSADSVQDAHERAKEVAPLLVAHASSTLA